MLILLGDTSLMFRFVSTVFGLPGSRVWWWMIRCHFVFLICHTYDAILGYIPFRMTFMDLHGVTWSFLLVRCAPRRWPIRHSYDDSLVKPLGSHPVRPTLLGIPMPPWLSLWDDFWTLRPDSVIVLDDWDHMFDDRWFHVTWFSTYHTFDATLGHISVLDEIYKSWWSYMLIPICETYVEMMIYSLSSWWFLSGASWELPC